MQLNQKEIEALIPHSGAMSLLNEVLKWDEDHIKNFLKKYYKKEKLEDLKKKDASKVIESLKNILKRYS